MNTVAQRQFSRSRIQPDLLLPLPSKDADPNRQRPIRVLLVDDHPVARKGIAFCLAHNTNLEIVGEAADGLDAFNQAKALLPDVVLTDLEMPQLDGLALTERLRRELPRTKIVVLSMHCNATSIRRSIGAGVNGYVLKGAPVEELVRSIETVTAGKTYFSPDVARLALNQFVRGATEPRALSDLTPREQEVLIRIAEGLSNKEIAHRLGLGVRTVETHRERLMRKLNIRNIAGLTKFALANGLITLPNIPAQKAGL